MFRLIKNLDKIFILSKLIFINILVFITLIIFIESTCYFARFITGRPSVGWIYQNSDPFGLALKDDCKRVRTHPFYGQLHDHNNKCKINGGGIVSGPFVFYGSTNHKNGILTLGGSTTDGFYTDIDFNGGITWPSALNSILESNKDQLYVVNGGNGGYGSSQELLKLIIDGQRLKSIKYIVSLNGINDMPGYRDISQSDEENLLFWTGVPLRMFSLEKYIKQDESKISNFLPSTVNIINHLVYPTGVRNNYSKENKWRNSIDMLNIGRSQSVAEQWFNNVKMMHAISRELGAKYYVFLQPTMGLRDIQIPEFSNSNDYLLYKSIDQLYLNKINSHYIALREYCAKLNYCIDITNIAPPNGNFYHDPRHHNQFGNELIAKKIYSVIFN